MTWPWVSRARYDRMLAAYLRADKRGERWFSRAAQEATERIKWCDRAREAQEHLDNVLIGLGMLDTEWITAAPGREDAVLADFNYRLACAVQFREAEPDGGMMGEGFINRAVESAKVRRENAERNLS